MPRQSKSTKTEVAEATTPAPSKKSASKAAAAPATPAAPAPEATADAADAADAETSDLAAQTTEFFTKLNAVSTMFASLKTEFRALEKKWVRTLKTAERTQSKRKRKTGNRQPSGFVKPTKISDELAKFLEKPVGTEMARTDVTREINKYIRSHNLQDKENGRKINPDAKLQSLLKLKKSDELTYFNLQRYMSPHFSKTEKAATA